MALKNSQDVLTDMVENGSAEAVDVCFVGGGVACLAAARAFTRAHPDKTVCILERADRLGGRLRMAPFEGASVPTGAGVVRMDKDVLLKELLTELKLPIKTAPMVLSYAFPDIAPVSQHWNTLLKSAKRSLTPLRRSRMTFRAFAMSVLGDVAYHELIRTMGFSDFEKADVFDTLLDYGVEDVLPSPKNEKLGFVDWNALIDALAKDVMGRRSAATIVRVNTEVRKLTWDAAHQRTHVYVRGDKQPLVSARKVVMGTPLKTLRTLLPGAAPLWNGIASQPFLRIYARFYAATAQLLGERVKSATVVRNALQKIIPIRADRGIYMIAYSDNANAVKIRPHMHNRAWLEKKVAEALSLRVEHVRIMRARAFYWEEGTHYFPPLKTTYLNRDHYIRLAQRPCPGVLVIGEGVSRNQGWTEGALESVRAILPDLTLTS